MTNELKILKGSIKTSNFLSFKLVINDVKTTSNKIIQNNTSNEHIATTNKELSVNKNISKNLNLQNKDKDNRPAEIKNILPQKSK